MDIQMSRWIIEFLIRQRVDDSILDRLIARLPLEDFDSRLKKALLLRRIQTEVSEGTVSEKILDLLELVGELDSSERKLPSGTMRAAYCAVAVDCTVRFLESEDNRMYDETLQRIWRRRVIKMGNSENSGLISEKLRSWKDDLEAASTNVELRDKILSRNTRCEALKAVKCYLAESWNEMGPSFLEKTAEDVYNMGKARQIVNEIGEEQGYEGLENVTEAHNGVTPSERPSIETQQKQGPQKRKHVGVRKKAYYKTGSKARISNIEELDNDTRTNKYPSFPTPEELDNDTRTNKIKADLESSFVDLNAVVRDPLPEALKIAEEVSSDIQGDTGLGGNHGGKMNVDSMPMDETDHVGVNSVENIRGDGHPERVQCGNGNQSLTSDPLEFSDDLSPNRPHLPSPRRSVKISPLKKYVMKKLEKRRPPRKWTSLEEDTLRKGIQEFGRGNWKVILMEYRDILEDRTEVDLKDKWRNLTRYS